jgi:phosphoribosylformylglycinamidine (FGAM) synthase PurS component
MIWRIEIKEKPGVFDSVGDSVRHDITDLGITTVRDVRVVSVYTIEGEIKAKEVERGGDLPRAFGRPGRAGVCL